MSKINELIDRLIAIKDQLNNQYNKDTINEVCGILAKVECGELVEVVKNPKAETVFRMIEKECQRNSLVDLCECWDITLGDFYEVTAAMLSGERSVEMTQRDKLIKLLDINCGYVDEMKAADLADYLLENGIMVLPCGVDLMKIYNELTSVCEGDAVENYTNGYRWGHKNGQIELIRRILNISEGVSHKPEQVVKDGAE